MELIIIVKIRYTNNWTKSLYNALIDARCVVAGVAVGDGGVVDAGNAGEGS